MTEQQHPITPPPELVEEWCDEWYQLKVRVDAGYEEHIAAQAARWGADQELEACCEWLINEGHEHEHNQLRAARRPQPPSLKEQALEALQSMRIDPVLIEGINVNADLRAKYKIILCALEQLDD